jgi:hypothetical protein
VPGTKFNSRKEDVIGEDYLGIMIFRFYFRCTRCQAEIAMKTDPKNSDYIVETGASRNYEPWRDKASDKEAAEAVGLYSCWIQMTHSLQAPGFNPCEPIKWVTGFKVCFFKLNLYRYTAEREAEEEGNSMVALENRTLESKREMDIMAALDEMQSLNKRWGGTSVLF